MLYTSCSRTCSPLLSSGKFMNNTGAAECFECPERYFCDGSSPREFVECPIGHYCETGTDVATSCPAGERGYAAVFGQARPALPKRILNDETLSARRVASSWVENEHGSSNNTTHSWHTLVYVLRGSHHGESTSLPTLPKSTLIRLLLCIIRYVQRSGETRVCE